MASTSKNPVFASTNIESTFNNDIIKEVLKSKFSNTKTKINDDAVELMTNLAKTIVIESSLRAARQASIKNWNTVTLDHMESVLPQLMLDFP